MKLIGLHGFTETGNQFRLYSSADRIAKELGCEAEYPDARHRNWHGSEQLEADYFLGYSDGAWRACLEVDVAHVVAYGSAVYRQPRGPERHTAILIRNEHDKTYSQGRLNDIYRRLKRDGHDVHAMMGRGDHMDRWDRSLNNQIIHLLKRGAHLRRPASLAG